MTYAGDRERLFWAIKCGVYQVQLFFCIFSQSFSISSISFFPGLDTGMSGIWPGTGLETFLLSCAMPLMIHNCLEPWCRCIHCPNVPGSLNLFFSTLTYFLLSANLPFLTSWNSTLKSFKNKVIQDEYSCCCCCFISFLNSSFYGRCYFILFYFIFYMNPLFFF